MKPITYKQHDEKECGYSWRTLFRMIAPDPKISRSGKIKNAAYP